MRTRSDLSAYKGWILYLRGEISEAEAYTATATETQRPDNPPEQRGLSRLPYLPGDQSRRARSGDRAWATALALSGSTNSFFRTTALSHLGQASD